MIGTRQRQRNGLFTLLSMSRDSLLRNTHFWQGNLGQGQPGEPYDLAFVSSCSTSFLIKIGNSVMRSVMPLYVELE